MSNATPADMFLAALAAPARSAGTRVEGRPELVGTRLEGDALRITWRAGAQAAVQMAWLRKQPFPAALGHLYVAKNSPDHGRGAEVARFKTAAPVAL